MPAPTTLVLRDRTVDLRRRVIHAPTGPIKISIQEADLLAFLAMRPGQTITFDELHATVWQHASTVVSRAAYYAHRRLLPKLEADPKLPQHLHLHRGVGLIFQPLPSETPTESTAADIPVQGRLPRPQNRFFGRQVALRQLVAKLMSTERLVVLTGPGGVGKTRLALAAAEQLQRQQTVGAWFADCSDASSVDDLCLSVALSLSLPLQADDPVVRVGYALRTKGRCVVLLDNLEQCVAVLPEVLPRWLQIAPQVTWLCTSRIQTRLRAEQLVPVPPLPIDAGTELLLDRAPVAVPAHHHGHAEALVERLQGLPLSIELVAVRLRVLPLPAVLERMDQQLEMLSRGGPEHVARHRSMAVSLSWSWSLLPDWAAAAMAQLSVCEGGFDLAAAAAIVAEPAKHQASGVLNVLQELVEASLLQADLNAGRSSMSAVVQQFAAEQLSDEDRLSAEARHGDHYARLVGPQTGGPASGLPAAELGNLMVACRRAITRADVEVALSTCEAAWEVIHLTGPFGVGLRLAQGVLTIPDLRGRHRARAELVAGRAARSAGRHDEALSHLEAALAGCREGGDERTEGLVLEHLGALHLTQSEFARAMDTYDDALAIIRRVGDRSAEGRVLGYLGIVDWRQGRTERACQRYRDALAIHRSVGNLEDAGIVLGNLGVLHNQSGRAAQALQAFEEALELHRAAGDRPSEGFLLGSLGLFHHRQGQWSRAAAAYQAALAIHEAVGARRSEGVVLGNLATLHFDQGQLEQAGVHLQAALKIHREVDDQRSEGIVLGSLGSWYVDRGEIEQARTHLQTALAIHKKLGNEWSEGISLVKLAEIEPDPQAARRLLASGEAILRNVSDPIELARALCARAELEHRMGQLDTAQAALAEAEALAVAAGVTEDSALGSAVAAAASTLRSRRD